MRNIMILKIELLGENYKNIDKRLVEEEQKK